jgi:hypothetical protein
MFMTFAIFLLEVLVVQFCANSIGPQFGWPEVDYQVAFTATLLFQTLTGVFKHQFYDWSATKSESFLIQVMAKNPQAVKVFMEALVDRVKAEQEQEELKNESNS